MKNSKVRKQNKDLTIEYSVVQGDSSESERRIHRIFEIIFDETMRRIIEEEAARG